MTAALGFLFAGRTILFVLGLFLGGMLTAASADIYQWMSLLVGWWNAILDLVLE